MTFLKKKTDIDYLNWKGFSTVNLAKPFERGHGNSDKITCVPSEDSDQHAHPHGCAGWYEFTLGEQIIL